MANKKRAAVSLNRTLQRMKTYGKIAAALYDIWKFIYKLLKDLHIV